MNSPNKVQWVIFLSGVTGTGKTTIGQYLATELDARFIEGDDVCISSPYNTLLLSKTDNWLH